MVGISVKRTLEEEMPLLQRLDGEILGLKEEQEICNKIERSSDIRRTVKKLFFQLIRNWRRLVFVRNVLVVIH